MRAIDRNLTCTTELRQKERNQSERGVGGGGEGGEVNWYTVHRFEVNKTLSNLYYKQKRQQIIREKEKHLRRAAADFYL